MRLRNWLFGRVPEGKGVRKGPLVLVATGNATVPVAPVKPLVVERPTPKSIPVPTKTQEFLREEEEERRRRRRRDADDSFINTVIAVEVASSFSSDYSSPSYDSSPSFDGGGGSFGGGGADGSW